MPASTRFAIVLLTCLLTSPCWITGIAVAADPEQPSTFFSGDSLLGAHRGGAAVWPEHTLVAYGNVAKRWPQAILEADLRLSRDGHVVLLHDETVDRTTNGQGRVAEITLADLKALDAGYRFTTDRGATHPYRGQDLQVLTLGEALEAFPDSRWLLETKPGPGIIEKTIEVVEAQQASHRVLLASFDAQQMRQARELAPAIATCFDTATGKLLIEALSGDETTWARYAPPAECLSLTRDLERYFGLDQAIVKRLQGKGIAVQIHTVNERKDMRRLIDMGIDSLLTDRPDLLADVMAGEK